MLQIPFSTSASGVVSKKIPGIDIMVIHIQSIPFFEFGFLFVSSLNLQQDPLFTDPEKKNWLSNNSIATYVSRGPLGFGPPLTYPPPQY